MRQRRGQSWLFAGRPLQAKYGQVRGLGEDRTRTRGEQADPGDEIVIETPISVRLSNRRSISWHCSW